MSALLSKVVRNLRRPLPELTGYVNSKLLSLIWRPYLRSVGKSFHVCGGTRIQGGSSVSIGDKFYGGPYLWIEAVQAYLGHRYSPCISIGSGVVCSHFVHIAATHHVSLGDGVLLGSGVHITDHSHGIYSGASQDAPDSSPSRRPLSAGRPVVLEDNVWLGDSVVVLPGVTIGRGTIVGANSVVSKSLPPHVIAVGSPARPIKRFDTQTGTWIPIITSA